MLEKVVFYYLFPVLELTQALLLFYLSFWDLKKMEVPDWPFNLGILLAGTQVYFLAKREGGFFVLQEHLFFGLLWFFFILSLFFLTKGKGIGLGDAKLFFWLGFKEGFWEGTLLFSLSLSLALFFLLPLLLLKKKTLKSRVPLVPFFAIGFIIKKALEI